MKTPKIINAISFVEDDLISAANCQKAKKPFYITVTFKRATAVAACLAIVAATVFTLTKKPDNNISSNNTNSGNKDTNSNNVSSNNDVSSNNSGETSSQNKKVIYVTGDTPDQSITDGSSIKSLKGKYISLGLQEKMDLYKDYTDAEVMYCVIVELFIANEDYDKASALATADKEVQSLYEQMLAAKTEVRKAEQERSIFNLSNRGNDPETLKKRKELNAICDEKEKIATDLWRQWSNLRSKIGDEYYDEVLNARLEFLKQLSEKKSIVTSYNDWAYYIDLTAEEINILVERGGYSFRLSNEKLQIAENC